MVVRKITTAGDCLSFTQFGIYGFQFSAEISLFTFDDRPFE